MSPTRRSAVLGLSASLAAALLAACAPTPATPPAPPAPAAATPPELAKPPSQAVPGTSKDILYLDPWSMGYEPAKNNGGTLNYAVSNTTSNLNPYGPNVQTRPYREVAYDTLVVRRLGPGAKVLAAPLICRLCESWEVQSGGKGYVFRLRQNIKWHDGQPLTADDIKFSFEKAGAKETGFELRSNLAGIDTMEVPDRYTFRATLKELDADFVLKLSDIQIVPKHAYDAGVDMLKTVIGTGPFKHGSFTPEVEYVAVRNPDFWLPDRPLADRMVAKMIVDSSTRVAAFLAKQVDLFQVANKKELEPIQRQLADVKIEPMNHINVNSFIFNVQRAPFHDKRVRQAVHLALDRDQLAEVYSSGLGPKYVAPATPADWQEKSITREELAKMPGYRQPKDADIAEAKRLLAEAGFPSGFKTTSMHRAGSIGLPEQNEAASAQLSRIGIDVTIQPVEIGVFTRRRAECDYEMLGDTVAGTRSSLTRNYLLYATDGAENACKYSNPEYDRLVAEQGRELDEAKRWELAKRIQRMLLDELPSAPWAETISYSLWQPYVHNWRNYGSAQAYVWSPTAELLWVDKH